MQQLGVDTGQSSQPLRVELVVLAPAAIDQTDVPRIGRDRLVPELLQQDARPEKLGAALLEYLENPKLAAALKEEFRRIHAILRNNADERAADAVLEVVGASTGVA